MKKTVGKNCIAVAAAIGLLFLAWGLAYVCVGNELIVPAFSDCMRALGALLLSSAFWKAFFSTLLRVVFAFALSFVSAAVFAVAAYLLPHFAKMIAPIVAVFRSAPTLAVLLVVLLFAGGGLAPVIVAFLTLFPTLYAGLYAALRNTDGALVEMSRAYKVPLKKRIFGLYLPAIAPAAAREGAAALALALKLVVSAEVLAATAKSLGGMMQEAKTYLDVPNLFALVIATFLVGLLVEIAGAAVATALERRTK